MKKLGIPEPRGKLTLQKELSGLTWLRVGGACEAFFQPDDLDDLVDFLRQLPENFTVFPMGVGSNLIIRDGGLDAVVVRLGRAFNFIEVKGDHVHCGAGALDAHVARKAADAGIDLTFLRTIPGAIGGAVRMNAGCYGNYTADVLVQATVVNRAGGVRTLMAEELGFGYRSSQLAPDDTVTQVVLAGPKENSDDLRDKMAAQLAKRDETQPTKLRSAGSTFRNPAGFSSTGKADDTHEMKAWKVIDDAGMRGATLGGAQMSEKHPNFLINADHATAAELEDLGELVRKKVFHHSGIELEWEVVRVGNRLPSETEKA